MSIRRSGEFPAITNLLGSAASFVPLHSVVGRSNVAAALPSRLPRLNSMRSHYETLGIPKEASAERIKRSYRKLVKLYHPDQFPSRSREQAEAEKRMRDINVAYSILSKPLSRTRYDAKLNGRAFSRIQVDPEHCCRCGKMTGHWQSTLRKVAIGSACVKACNASWLIIITTIFPTS